MILTIITPTLNCNKTINETIQSIIELEKNFKGKIIHLIGDGGSVDGTINTIKLYEKNYSHVRFYALNNLNIPETLNILLNDLNSDYYLVLNGDDYIYSDIFFSELKNVIDLSFKGIFSGAITVADLNSKVMGIRLPIYNKLKNYMSVNHPAMLAHKSVFQKIGKFDVKYPHSYDYCWTWKAYVNDIEFMLSEKEIAFVRLGGISQLKSSIAAKEIFYYKIYSRNYLNAFINYLIFNIKLIIKYLLSRLRMSFLIKVYRKLLRSPDKY